MRFGYVLLGLVALTSIYTSHAVACDRGYPGVQKDDICCDATCGTCGGSGCKKRSGGSKGCCSSRIRSSGKLCDITKKGPCIMNGATHSPFTTPSPTGVSSWVSTEAPTELQTPTPTPVPVATCSNGLVGFEDGSICCELQCGTCGGSGCSRRPGGKAGCCSSVINMSEVMCSEATAAPCIIDN